VGQTGARSVPIPGADDLSFIRQTPERCGVEDPSSVTGEGAALFFDRYKCRTFGAFIEAPSEVRRAVSISHL